MPTTDQVRYVSLIFPSTREFVFANSTSRLRFRTCTRSVNRWKNRAKRKWVTPFPPSGPRCECGTRSKESITCGVIANIEPHGMIVRSSWPSKSESLWDEKGFDARLWLISLFLNRMRRMYRRRRGLSSSGSSNSAWSTPTMLSPATEHPPGANTSNENKSNNNNKPNLGLLGASGLSSISPNGVTDGHVTSPEEIEENDKDGDRGGGGSDYFGSRGSGGARRE
jgi:hypothetical protein